MILLNILESEDSYEDLESSISKVRKYSHPCFTYLILFIFVDLSTSDNILRCQPQLIT